MLRNAFSVLLNDSGAFCSCRKSFDFMLHQFQTLPRTGDRTIHLDGRRFLRGVISYDNTAKSSTERIKEKDTQKMEHTDVASGVEQHNAAVSTRRVKRLLEKSLTDDAASEGSDLDVWSRSSYAPEAAEAVRNKLRQQNRHLMTPKGVDPRQTTVLLFPGQGSQFVGMAAPFIDSPNVRRMYAAASEILGYDLLDVCLNGPNYELNRTLKCQPAVVVTGLAAAEKLRDEVPHAVDGCIAVAGFSVGEITALIFSGALSFEDGIKLVRIRAEAMQAASDEEPSGMMTVFYGADARVGFACSAAREWCKRRSNIETPQCTVANYLFPGCKVIAGHEQALKFIELNAKDFGIRRLKRLAVSGAFHTPLMGFANYSLKEALREMDIQIPIVSVHSNVDGRRYRNADHVRRQLPKQVTSPVKWEQTLHVLYERKVGTAFPNTYECGAGGSLSVILQQVNAKAFGTSFRLDNLGKEHQNRANIQVDS